MPCPSRRRPDRPVTVSEALESRVLLSAQIVPARDGAGPLNPSWLTDAGGAVFFTASDGQHGTELWHSDGTAAGTSMVKDITPGPEGTFIEYLTALGSTVYFKAVTTGVGEALWKSDGTEAGTVMVFDPVAGTTPADVKELTAMNGRMYFVAQDDSVRYHVWESDGTAAGTFKLERQNTSIVDHLTAVGNRLYWRDGVALKMYDRTQNIVYGELRRFSIGPIRLTDVNGTCYFVASDGTNGLELWKASGTSVSRVKDIVVGAGDSNPQGLVNVNGTLMFFVTGGDQGGLWRSNGTSSGTTRVAATSSALAVTGAGATLYFTATDPQAGAELFKSDGTAAGTVLVKDIVPGPAGSSPSSLTPVGSGVFFVAQDTVWRSDGTAAGTRPVVRTYPDGFSAQGPLVPSGQSVFFLAYDETGHHLWRATQAPGAAVTGNVLNDRDGDGARDTGEPGLPRRLVYNDADNDGAMDPAEWRTVTDDNGDYRLDGLPAGSYRVRLKLGPGWRQTAPASGAAYTGALTASQVVTGKNFAAQGTRPTVRSASYARGARRGVLFQFDGFSSVIPTLGVDDFSLVNRDTGQAVAASALSLVTPSPDSPEAAGAGQVTLAIAHPVLAGNYRATLRAAGVADADGYALAGGDFVFDFVLPSLFVGAHLFYNNSSFDGHDPAPTAADDAAIVPDKLILQPGMRPSVDFGSDTLYFTTYSRGINGVMVDLAGATGAISAADFDLRVGNDPDLAKWTAAPAPAAVATRRGAAPGGADRITLTWADGSIVNTWLRVAVKATTRTGLDAPAVFYVGNFIGDSGADLSRGLPRRQTVPSVHAYDLLATRRAISTRSVDLRNKFDFDRDGMVTWLDVWIVRRSMYASPLRMFTMP